MTGTGESINRGGMHMAPKNPRTQTRHGWILLALWMKETGILNASGKNDLQVIFILLLIVIPE